jgi:general secretion pathway protein N
MKIGLRAFGLILLGLVAYIVFLLISLPAAQAWAWFGGQVPVQAFGISGTVWQGQAALVSQQDRRLEAVQWEVRPSSLLLGQLRANVQARMADGRLRGDVAVSPGGRFTARQLRLDMPATELVQWAGLSLPVRVEGQLDTLMQDLVVNGPRIIRADGLVSWHGAAISFGSSALPLGNLALRLEPGADGTSGVLTSHDGPIEIGGKLNMTPDGKFVMDLAVQVVGELPDDVLPSMKLLGIPADGRQVHARMSGNLDGSGLRLEPLNP